MNDPLQLFAPLIGQMAWLVDTGYGTSIKMEFGQPHLEITEPVLSPNAQSPQVRRMVTRRHVSIMGDWHFWVMYGAWKLTTTHGSINSEMPTRDGWQPFLDDLSGQKLLSVDSGRDGSVQLKFDLGGTLEVWPLAGDDGEIWAIHRWAGEIYLCKDDGSIETVAPQG